MIFLSDSTLLCEEISYTPTNINDITKVILSNAWFNDLFVWTSTEDPTAEMPAISAYSADKDGELYVDYEYDKFVKESIIPDDWDFNTVMRAHYEDSTMAGNVDWRIDELRYVIIKRKKVTNGTYKENEENKWITLKVNDIFNLEDEDEKYAHVNIKGTDLTAGSGKYIYAIVPIFEGNVEGAYLEAEPLDVYIDRLVIVDKDEVWSTIFIDGGVSIQYVVPSTPVETMYQRYPVIVSNGDANYRTITVDAEWLPMDENCGYEAMDDDIVRVEYNDRFLEFLHNKEGKILKAANGRLFFIYITTPASISIEDSDILEKVSFGGTEIGSIYNEELLYKTGFTDVTAEWWFK